MARRSRRMHLAGPALLLVIAGAVAAAHSNDPLPVNIAGGASASNSQTASQKATRQAAGAMAADSADGRPDQSPPSLTEIIAGAENGALQGDAMLRGALDLRQAQLENDRYMVKLDKTHTAVLTLDPAVQAAAEDALARAKAPVAAIVVMGVDGRILALAGMRQDGDAPAPDAALADDPDLALGVWAPAASVFKLVTAAALVEAGLRSGSKVCYHGGLRSVEPSNLVDNKKRDTACGVLADGVSKSQNAIIAKLAHRHLQPAVLRTTARAFGFDRMPEFALPAEPSKAQIPSDDLAFARVSAGFWNTELSPLGGALIANTVATGGMAVTPRIVDRLVTRDLELPVEPAPSQRVLAERVAHEVARMMVATTETGTAYKGFHDLAGRKFLPTMQVAGKTGTLTRTSPSYLEYSWFVGFAPSDKPQVSIAVLLGNPPRWHLKAHTAARLVLEEVF